MFIPYLINAIIIIAILVYLFESIVQIPVGYLAIPTTWGKRDVNSKGEVKVIKEGWKFVPWFIKDLILINMFRKRLTISIKGVRTPDRAESDLELLLTYIPTEKNINSYFISGGEEGVNEQMIAKTEERVRRFVSGSEEGPQNWEELMQSHKEIIGVLLRQIADDESVPPLPEYAQKVPTWIWMRYYSQPRPTSFTEKETEWADDDWVRVKEVENTFSQQEILDLQEEVSNRKKMIDKLSSGNAGIEVKDLGITIQTTSLSNVSVSGEVAKKAELEAKEKEEKKAEVKEITHFGDLSDILVNKGHSHQDAKEIIQSERGKVPMNIDVKKIRIDTDLVNLVNKLLEGRK